MVSACAHTSTTACTLQVLHAAQVLAHYLMLDQLSATADCCQQTALEDSEPWSGDDRTLYLSGHGDATLRIVAKLFCCLLS